MTTPASRADPAWPRSRTWPIRTGTVPPLAEGFTGRPETAPDLAATLVPGTAVALAPAPPRQRGERAGSCGKTQLAVSCAQALWRGGRVELLAWVDASSRASMLAGYLQAAAAVGLDLAGPAERVAARFTGWLADTARRWLVVLDDVRDPTDLDGLWPGGPAGSVLVTTSGEETVAGEPGQPRPQVVPVGPFSAREALSYLMGQLAGDPDQRKGAIDLAAALGGDPCALAQASAVITSTTQTCQDYLRHYNTARARLAAQRAGGEPPAAVAVTGMLSAERAGQLSPGGGSGLLLGLAALLDGQPVPGPVLTTAAVRAYLAQEGMTADVDRAWEAVRALEQAGLLVIDRAATPPLVRMPRVVAALARAALPGRALERAADAAAGALLEAWPRQEPRPWLAAGLRSCVAGLRHTAEDHLWAADGCHPLLVKAGCSLEDARLTGPAARYWAQLAAASDTFLGPDHPATLSAGGHMAQALAAAGQSGEAAAWWQWVATGRGRTYGPDHPETITARVNQGRALVTASQPREAITVLEQAVADLERVRGPGHPLTLSARDDLAAAYQAAGQPATAIEHYQRALASRERACGPRHLATITARENLARACLAARHYKDAISHYKKALAGRQRVLGPDHPDALTGCRHLAAAYQAAGNIAAALHVHKQACASYERVLGADHPDTLAARADLAGAYLTAGRLTDAATLLRDTLTRCEQTLPPGDPLTQALRQSMTSLAAG